jgi:hypothetical protein
MSAGPNLAVPPILKQLGALAGIGIALYMVLLLIVYYAKWLERQVAKRRK